MVASATARENEALVRSFAEQGIAVDYIGLDISSEGDRAHALEWIREKYGRIDLLVNNAGVAPTVRADILETSRESFRRLMHINLEGCFFMCQLFANEMVRLVQAGHAAGLSSAHREHQLHLGLHLLDVARGILHLQGGDLDVHEAVRGPAGGVRHPGVRGAARHHLTDMTAGVKEKYEKLIAEGVTPIRRFGRPEDVAACVSAAAGGDLDFATGQVLNADGGFHLRRL